MNIASCVRAFMINYSQVPLSKLQLLLKLCQCKMSERGTQESRLMDYHRHRENTGMVTSPHGAIFLLVSALGIVHYQLLDLIAIVCCTIAKLWYRELCFLLVLQCIYMHTFLY